MTDQTDRFSIGLRIVEHVQAALKEDEGNGNIAFDIVLRDGSAIECIWEIEVDDGLVRTDSAVSVSDAKGLAYAFPVEEILLARPHGDRPSPGQTALEWGVAALKDKEFDYTLLVRMKSGVQIAKVHLIEIDGDTASIGSIEVCNGGISHVVAVDQVEAVWIETVERRRA